MAEKTFFAKLRSAARQNSSWLCVGLDPQFFYLPAQFKQLPSPEAVLKFNQAIIKAASPYVCAFKPNLAYYEVLGPAGLQILKKTLEAIPPEIPVILDGKRSDVGHSANFYAQAAFDFLKADAVTVNPYLGFDALEPFLQRGDKGIFILCLTSNPGAADFQKAGQPPLYAQVAKLASEKWNKNKNCGLVVGSTAAPADWQKIKEVAPGLPWLIPGLGAQGGELENLVAAAHRMPSRNSNTQTSNQIPEPTAGQTSKKALGGQVPDQQDDFLLFNVSRSIIFASSGDDFAVCAAREAKAWRDRLNQVLLKVQSSIKDLRGFVKGMDIEGYRDEEDRY